MAIVMDLCAWAGCILAHNMPPPILARFTLQGKDCPQRLASTACFSKVGQISWNNRQGQQGCCFGGLAAHEGSVLLWLFGDTYSKGERFFLFSTFLPTMIKPWDGTATTTKTP